MSETKSSSFGPLMEQSAQLQHQAAVVRSQQRQVQEQMKGHLVHVLKAYHQAFEGVRDLDDEEVRIPDRYDMLEHWAVDGQQFEATLGYGFRGEHHTYQVSLPVKYLEADGLTHLQSDAHRLRHEQEAQRQREQDAEDLRLRELFETLKGRFEPASPEAPVSETEKE